MAVWYYDVLQVEDKERGEEEIERLLYLVWKSYTLPMMWETGQVIVESEADIWNHLSC